MASSPIFLEVPRVPLIKNTYGKGRVRVMRVHRDGDRHEVSQLSIKAMIEGDFGRAFTDADNSTSTSTDTIKNIVNVTARENLGLCTEEFCWCWRSVTWTSIRRSPASPSRRMKPNGAGCRSTARRIRTASCSTATASRPWR